MARKSDAELKEALAQGASKFENTGPEKGDFRRMVEEMWVYEVIRRLYGRDSESDACIAAFLKDTEDDQSTMETLRVLKNHGVLDACIREIATRCYEVDHQLPQLLQVARTDPKIWKHLKDRVPTVVLQNSGYVWEGPVPAIKWEVLATPRFCTAKAKEVPPEWCGSVHPSNVKLFLEVHRGVTYEGDRRPSVSFSDVRDEIPEWVFQSFDVRHMSFSDAMEADAVVRTSAHIHDEISPDLIFYVRPDKFAGASEEAWKYFADRVAAIGAPFNIRSFTHTSQDSAAESCFSLVAAGRAEVVDHAFQLKGAIGGYALSHILEHGIPVQRETLPQLDACTSKVSINNRVLKPKIQVHRGGWATIRALVRASGQPGKYQRLVANNYMLGADDPGLYDVLALAKALPLVINGEGDSDMQYKLLERVPTKEALNSCTKAAGCYIAKRGAGGLLDEIVAKRDERRPFKEIVDAVLEKK